MKLLYQFIILSLLTTHLYSQSKLFFVIRVDDIMSRNTTVLPRSIKPFEQVIEGKGGKITWFVIPHRLIESTNNDGSLTRELRQTITKGHEIAQHGYNHICQKCNSTNHEMKCTTYNSSFTYNEQKKLVEDGIKILWDSIGVIPKTWVSPAHQEDSTTFFSLVEKGFEWISTTSMSKSFIYPNLFNLSPHKEFTWALTSPNYSSALNSALQDIRSKIEVDKYYCIYFHDYFIRSGYENGIVLNWISELLDSVKNIYGSRLEFKTVSQAAQYFRDQFTKNDEQVMSNYSSYRMDQNYPNPFNSSTVITFQIAKELNQQLIVNHVTVKVYDLLGREIRTLVDDFRQPGIYKITFDANSLHSGVYLLQMKVGSFSATKKMLLIK